jgi:putative ABC transport system substrate-binding protein
MNRLRHNCCQTTSRLLILPAALLLLGVTAYAQETLLLLKSRDSPQHEEVVGGFLEQWNSQATNLHVEQQTLANVSNFKPVPIAVVAVGTEAARWALAHTTGPVVFCMIANARQNLLASLGENDRQRAWGVSLNVPVKIQFQEIRELMPDARRIGVIYDPKKSSLAIEEAESAAADLAIDLVTRQVDSEASLPEATAWISPRIDVLWAPIDATVFTARNAQFVLMQMLQRKVPVFGFSENMVKAGALAAPRVDYTAVGRQTAELLASVLDGTNPPGGTVQPPKVHDIVANQRISRLIGKPIASSPTLRIGFINEE